MDGLSTKISAPSAAPELTLWNDVSIRYPEPANLQLLAEAQAARTPDAPAVAASGCRLTYRELHERANRLAHLLQNQGVGPESAVAVLLERSVEMVVALLGVLKAGAAYLPLDPTHPAERLALLLADSGAEVLLVQERFRFRIPTGSPTVLSMDELERLRAGRPAQNPACRALPENAAYIIYTSGSTGRPKAVVNTHRAICNRLLWGQEYFGLGPRDRVLQKTPYTFDVSVWEIFAPLIAGSELVLARPEGHRDNGYLIDLIREREITTVHFVPSMLSAFLGSAGVETCRSLRRVVASGEALTPELARRFYLGLPHRDIALYNLYGPTEAAVEVSAWALPQGGGEGPVPIGRPIANLRLYVHDGNLLPMSPGGPGELLIGGVGLARGYLGRPDQTAESFVPDSFSGEEGGRLYRTGDLVRRREDGALEYLGRLDHQVKLRGYRVELGEIEAALRRCPGVVDGAVVLREDTPGDQRLVAYVVPEGEPASASEWQRFLARSLPEYMVPSAFVTLLTLPQNAHGKVDRRSLPAPDRVRPELTETFIAPRSPLERTIADLWADLLNLDRVGVEDNFFHLGGHSLLVAQALSRLRQAFSLEMPLTEFFRRPTVAALAERIERGAQGKPSSDIPEPPPIRRPPRGGRPLPLSFAQQRVWFMDQLVVGGNMAYNFQVAIWLRGPLRVEALKSALGEIVRRHEVLRTTFPEVDGWPCQVIHPAAPVPLPQIDLRCLPSTERRRHAERLIFEIIRIPFDLVDGPLIRWRLLRLGEDAHVLVQVEHHFVHDGWSFAVLFGELRDLYLAYSRGEASRLPELPVQYADYAIWQREWMRGAVLERLLAYWERKLAGSPPPVELPTDRPRPLGESFRGWVLALPLAPEIYGDLRRFSRRQGTTLYTTMLAGFLALLHRYTGEVDLVIGTSNANRRLRELERVIGMMVNSLPLRADLSGQPTFQSLLERTRDLAVEAHAHQDLPFDQLVQSLHVDRRPGRNPVFQLMFNFHDAPVPDGRAGGLEMVPELRANGTSKMDLNLIVVPRAEQRVGREGSAEDRWAIGRYEYNADLFDAATIHRLDAQLQALLQGAVADPLASLSELPVLSRPERQQAIVEWGDRLREDDGGCLHERFVARADQAPEAVAVTCGEWNLSYGELSVRSAGLAARLAREGVLPGDRVALFLDRSLEMVVAILGVLRAGAAYVPLDPDHPRERLGFILEDARPKVLISREELRRRLPAHGAAVVCLEASRDPRGKGSAVSLPTEATAYVIYTSGSTGRPKGVLVSHANAVRLFTSTRELFDPAPIDVWTLFHSYAFDFSVWELWGALLHGGRLVVVPYWVSRSPESFLALLAAERVTVLNQTPSAFRALSAVAVTEPPPVEGDALALRLVLFGGEALEPKALAPWFERHGDLRPRLVNLYGITETTVHVTWHPLGREEGEGGSGSRIGRALPDLSLDVLDRWLQPAPVGVPGEICVGGEGLAAGYLNRPDLTAAAFVPDPFHADAGLRLYRSGDLGRLLPDGTVEYLGRLDHQVKIRGFRIELGEIEAALARHPAVERCVVQVRDDPPAEPRLVAYVVPVSGRAAIGGELRESLRESLPEYMVPALFVELPALALTPTGKVDRRALPAPGAACSETEYVAPQSPAEEILAEVWAGVLGVERVGLRDNFFDLGGHSLLATRAATRIAALFGIEVPVRAIFEAPTVAAFSLRLARLAGERRSEIPPFRPVRRDRPFALSFAQQRLWFLHRMAPESSTYHMSRAYRLAEPLCHGACDEAFHRLIERHEVLRTRVFCVNGEPVQQVSSDGGQTLPLLDLGGLPGPDRENELRRLARDTFRSRYDLAADPPLRARLVRLGDEECLLLLSLHHIAADGWSMGILEREWSAIYEALRAGRSAPLAPLPFQYGDFAGWQREWLQGEVLEREVEHWRERLSGAPFLLALPTDRPRPAVQSFRGGSRDQALSPELEAALRDLARGEGVTLFMVFLAVVDLLLHRYTGATDLLVGTPIANRNRAETEGLIGFFANTLVLRTELAGNPVLRHFLANIRETALEAYGHQDLPFEKLVEELRPERHLGHSPLFQVVCAVEESAAAPGVTAGRPPAFLPVPLPVENDTAKFDLTLSLVAGRGRLSLQANYSSDLFDRSTVLRLLRHAEILLSASVAAPGNRLLELPWLDAAERSQLLIEWSANGPEEDDDAGIPARIVAQVARSPHALALHHGVEHLTYAELARRSEDLAARLRELEIGAESVVGVLLRRSVEMVVALLGVMRAGGAYLPLDPSYPRERLAFMLRDAAAAALLTDPVLGARLAPGGEGPRQLFVGSFGGGSGETGAGERVEPFGERLAYVIYTSGSTGHPKGVEVEHRSLENLVRWHLRTYGVTPADRSTQVAAPGFDAAVWEIWPPLVAGASLHLPEDEVRIAPAALRDDWLQQGITLSFLPTPLAEGVLALSPPEAGALRVLLTGGDRLHHRPSGDLTFALVNHYGPTEGTVVATSGRVAAGETERSPAIGRALPGVRVQALDGEGRPVACGVPGELYLGGRGLARGYRGRPEWTAERFLPDPWGPPGARLYRTGDLVRFRADGELEYLGRTDRQVKIRGFRIELGEIESLLGTHSTVREAVVVHHRSNGRPEELVAYVVPRGEESLEIEELRRFLARHLPGYAVPGTLVPLAALPLSAHGKVDRSALPAPEHARRPIRDAAAEDSGTLARTALERRIAHHWRELLGLAEVRTDDNFFDLGGHSLLVAQMQARLQDDLGRTVSIVDLFRYPTIRALAVCLEVSIGDVETGARERTARETRSGSASRRRELRRQHRAGGPLHD